LYFFSEFIVTLEKSDPSFTISWGDWGLACHSCISSIYWVSHNK
jgi:hypothetical protein